MKMALFTTGTAVTALALTGARNDCQIPKAPFGPRIESAASAVAVESFPNVIRNSEIAFSVPKEPEKSWTKRLERRFQALSEAEAFGTLTESEAEEFRSLIKDRRRLISRRSAEEILAMHRQQVSTLRLIEAMESYARHFQPDKR